MSPWNDNGPWLLGEPEPNWTMSALALVIALLLAWLVISGKFDPAPVATAPPSGAPAASESDQPMLMYDVRLALDQMSRQV